MQPKPLPEPNVDFYELAETLPADELATLKQARRFMHNRVAPIINEYWAQDAFPFELLPELKKLNIMGAAGIAVTLRGRRESTAGAGADQQLGQAADFSILITLNNCRVPSRISSIQQGELASSNHDAAPFMNDVG